MSVEFDTHNALIFEAYSVRTSGLRWMAVHGALCLALRHPQFTFGHGRDLALLFCRELGKKLVQENILTAEQLRLAERIEQEESPHGW